MDVSSTFVAPISAALAVAIATGCGRREELHACNIDDRTCQEDVYYAVIRARGDGFDPFDGVPPIRNLTKEQYRRELFPERSLPDDTTDPPVRPTIDPWDVSLQQLGLLRRMVSAEDASGEDFALKVAAFYTWATQTVTVVVDPELCPDDRNLRWETTLLAHELVHALQDNESNLTVSDGTVDGDFASSTLIEGEARMYEYLLGAEIDEVSPQALDWEHQFEIEVDGERAAVAVGTSRFFSVWTYAYPLGSSVFMQRWLQGGNAAVRDLSRHAPRRSVDYMAAHAGAEVTPAPALTCQPAAPSPAFDLTHLQRLGALQLHAFLMGTEEPPNAAETGESAEPVVDDVGMKTEHAAAPGTGCGAAAAPPPREPRAEEIAAAAAAKARAEALLAREPDAWRTALEWRDDQLFIYFDPDGQSVALTWRVRFASQAAAERTVAAANRLPALRAERRGRDALIVSADPGLPDWPGADECDR